MKIYKMSDMVRGWFVGDFHPSAFQTKDFEVGILHHKKGEEWPRHFHKVATEINVLLSGRMIINKQPIFPNDIFILGPHEISKPTFIEDCVVLCIKTPSIPGDKYIV